MHCTPLASPPQIPPPRPTFNQPTAPTDHPIPPSIPILNSSSDLPRTANPLAHPQAAHILSLMAQPNDSEVFILEALQQTTKEDLRIYQHPYYGSLLEAALKFIRPETLQFLLPQGSSIPTETYLDTLSEEQLVNTLKTLAEIWSKHHHSRGHRDFDRPAVSFPVVKKMTQVVASLYKAKTGEKATSGLFPDNLKTKKSYQGFLKEIEGQRSYCFKVDEEKA